MTVSVTPSCPSSLLSELAFICEVFNSLTVLILLIVIYLLASACLCCTGLFHLLFQLTQDPGAVLLRALVSL